jgi:hypothetical protein
VAPEPEPVVEPIVPVLPLGFVLGLAEGDMVPDEDVDPEDDVVPVVLEPEAPMPDVGAALGREVELVVVFVQAARAAAHASAIKSLLMPESPW